MTRPIFGRDAELAALESWFADPTPELLAQVLVGEPGIGKTAIIDAVIATASARELTVLSARPAESEQAMAYVALGDLLGPVTDLILPRLPSVQRLALEVALVLRIPDAAGGDPRTIAAATRTALELLGESGPIVIAIDDLQWLDAASAGALEFAFRRLSGRRIRLLLGVRSIPGADMPSTAASFRRALPDERVTISNLGGVSIGALSRLLREQLGQPIPRHALLRLHGSSSGNALLALEMARALLARPGGLDSLDVPTLSRELTALVDDRLASLPADTRALLVIAAADSLASIDELREITGGDLNRRIRPAIAAGIATTVDGHVRFLHPLYAAAAYASATREQRTAAHRALSGTSVEPDRRARHVALASNRPQAAAAKAVEQGALAAARRGAPAAAAELLAHARRLTPRADRMDALRRVVGEAELRWAAGEPSIARRLLDEAIEALPSGRLRVEAMLLQAVVVEWSDGGTAAERILRAALRQPLLDPDLEAAVRLRLATTTRRPVTISRHAAIALARLGRAPDRYQDLRACALLVRAEACLRLGRPLRAEDVAAALALLDGQHEGPRSVSTFPAEGIARENEWIIAIRTDQLQTGRSLLTNVVATFTDLGMDRSRAIALAELSVTQTWLGEIAAAAASARMSLELADETGATPYARAMALLATATAEAERGDSAEARRAIDEALGRYRVEIDGWLVARILAVRGRAELFSNHPRAAVAAFDEIAEIVELVGDREPADLRYEGDYVEAAIAVGEHSKAERIVADLERRRRAAPRPWLDLMVARGRGLLAAAAGDIERGLEELRAGTDAGERLPMPVEIGRSRVIEGRLRRRLRQKLSARDAFHEAERRFVQAGAAGLAASARADAGRVGIRPPTADELTATERQVAEAAARGLTNRQVAEAAFLSPKSVDGVLARVYQKLGIHSRAELGARLGDRDPTAVKIELGQT